MLFVFWDLFIKAKHYQENCVLGTSDKAQGL